jgi:hypothetical protein
MSMKLGNWFAGIGIASAPIGCVLAVVVQVCVPKNTAFHFIPKLSTLAALIPAAAACDKNAASLPSYAP